MKKKILIVDDEETSRKILSIALESRERDIISKYYFWQKDHSFMHVTHGIPSTVLLQRAVVRRDFTSSQKRHSPSSMLAGGMLPLALDLVALQHESALVLPQKGKRMSF